MTYPSQRYAQRANYLRTWASKQAKWKAQLKVDIGKECADCGYECTIYNTFVFDWDHRPGEEKLFTLARRSAKDKILAEIAKCDLVCANCHRFRTHNRRLDAQSEPMPTQ